MTVKSQPRKPLSFESLQWLMENKDAIAAYNERIAKYGMLITPEWLLRAKTTEPES